MKINPLLKAQIELFFANIEYYTIGILQGYIKKIKRSLAFAKLAWNNYDWDYGYLLELEVFKLKRMLYSFEKYGNHSEKCDNYGPKMKSLKLAIKIGERLNENNYYRYINLHDKKWGETIHIHHPIDVMGNSVPKEDAKLFRWEAKKPKANTPEEIEQERKEFREAAKKDDRERDKHRKLFYSLIYKHGERWWD